MRTALNSSATRTVATAERSTQDTRPHTISASLRRTGLGNPLNPNTASGTSTQLQIANHTTHEKQIVSSTRSECPIVSVTALLKLSKITERLGCSDISKTEGEVSLCSQTPQPSSPPRLSRRNLDRRSTHVEPPTLITQTTAAEDSEPLSRAEPFKTHHTQGGK
ncbi:hypothetical protein ES703_95732 [subsurface metagenome]